MEEKQTKRKTCAKNNLFTSFPHNKNVRKRIKIGINVARKRKKIAKETGYASAKNEKIISSRATCISNVLFSSQLLSLNASFATNITTLQNVFSSFKQSRYQK